MLNVYKQHIARNEQIQSLPYHIFRPLNDGGEWLMSMAIYFVVVITICVVLYRLRYHISILCTLVDNL